jgi:hypothetical protein
MSLRALAALWAGAIVVALAACADDGGGGSGGDGGADASADVVQREAAPPPPAEGGAELDRETCIADCSARHPSGRTKDDAIAACWAASCAGRCTPGVGGDGGAPVEDAGACAWPVTTDDPRCDLCTRSACCAPWDACFGDAECSAFNTCRNRCPAD